MESATVGGVPSDGGLGTELGSVGAELGSVGVVLGSGDAVLGSGGAVLGSAALAGALDLGVLRGSATFAAPSLMFRSAATGKAPDLSGLLPTLFPRTV